MSFKYILQDLKSSSRKEEHMKGILVTSPKKLFLKRWKTFLLTRPIKPLINKKTVQE